jgi:hypothetical protein
VQVDEPPLTPLTVMPMTSYAISPAAPSAPIAPIAETVAQHKKGALVDIQDRDAPVCFE